MHAAFARWCLQAKSPFKPLAERVREFQFKTPTRFKSKPSAKPASNKKKSPITKAEVSYKAYKACRSACADVEAGHTIKGLKAESKL